MATADADGVDDVGDEPLQPAPCCPPPRSGRGEHERAGEAVVEPGLGGEGEVRLVLVLVPGGPTPMSPASTGPSARARRRAAARRGGRQAEQLPAEQGDEPDGDRHRDRQQARHGAPGAERSGRSSLSRPRTAPSRRPPRSGARASRRARPGRASRSRTRSGRPRRARPGRGRSARRRTRARAGARARRRRRRRRSRRRGRRCRTCRRKSKPGPVARAAAYSAARGGGLRGRRIGRRHVRPRGLGRQRVVGLRARRGRAARRAPPGRAPGRRARWAVRARPGRRGRRGRGSRASGACPSPYPAAPGAKHGGDARGAGGGARGGRASPRAGWTAAPPPGDAQDALAVALEQRLALRVVLAGDAVLVPGRAVGFEDEPLGGPAEVGHDAATVEHDRGVDLRPFEAAASRSSRTTSSSSCGSAPGRRRGSVQRAAARGAAPCAAARRRAARGGSAAATSPARSRGVAPGAEHGGEVDQRALRAVTRMPSRRVISSGRERRAAHAQARAGAWTARARSLGEALLPRRRSPTARRRSDG